MWIYIRDLCLNATRKDITFNKSEKSKKFVLLHFMYRERFFCSCCLDPLIQIVRIVNGNFNFIFPFCNHGIINIIFYMHMTGPDVRNLWFIVKLGFSLLAFIDIAATWLFLFCPPHISETLLTGSAGSDFISPSGSQSFVCWFSSTIVMNGHIVCPDLSFIEYHGWRSKLITLLRIFSSFLFVCIFAS